MNMTNKVFKSISILGCGWLGLPLAKHLVSENFKVKGSTTSENKLKVLKEASIDPFLIKIDTNEGLEKEIQQFLNSDFLLINVPFGKQKENFDAYKKLIGFIENSPIKKVIFISSTSVYKDTNGVIIENANFKINPAKQQLVDLENLFLNNTHFSTNIIRFSGLLGGSRNPGNFFKPDRVVQNGLAPINLIHLDDCIGIISAILKNNHWNEVFNASADSHPTRKEFYTAASIQNKKTPATFLENTDFSFKVISNEKIKRILNYQFIHSDLMKMLETFKV